MLLKAIKFTVISIFVFSHILIAGQKIKYKFEKGRDYKYSTSIESKIEGQAMGQEFTLTSAAFVDYTINSKGLNENVYNLTVTFDKFDIKINLPMMGFNDSTISMKEYLGKRVKVALTDLGKTLSIDPIDTIQPSRIQSMANLTPNELFKNLLLQLPNKELDVNSSWKNDSPDTTSRRGMKVISKQNIEMKVVGVEKELDLECWKISVSGVNILEGSGSQQGNDITIDGSNKINGTVLFAPKEGLLTSSKTSVESDMTTTFTGANTGASTMIINTTSKTTLLK